MKTQKCQNNLICSQLYPDMEEQDRQERKRKVADLDRQIKETPATDFITRLELESKRQAILNIMV